MTEPDAVPAPADVTATFCATLVDEWARAGVAHVVVAPGSRSTPLALAVAADERLEVHVHHDERSAAFLALGLALGGGAPVVVVTTSGTAAVELHPAVVEAHQAGVPLIACTADRPPELQDVGAPQTVDQAHLYGRALRWFHQPGVPEWAARSSWRSLAARSVAEARGAGRGLPPGPVHLDLAFREPLVGTAQPLPAGREGGRPWHEVVPPRATPVSPDGDRDQALAELLSPASGRGVVVCGGGAPAAEAALLAATLGWPVLADPRSGVRADGSARAGEADDAPVVVTGFDPVVRSPFGAANRPDVVVWLGDRPASKVLGEWVRAAGAAEVAVPGQGRWTDPARSSATVLSGPADAAVARLLVVARTAGVVDRAWAAGWAAAASASTAAVDDVLDRHAEPTEPATARATTRACAAAGADLVVSSSMPIRDVEWFGEPGGAGRVLANRGANGIDGVVSTTVGVALANRGARPTALLIGDVALLHDSNGLLGLAGRGVDLTLVVVDNDGGGIFSFLPQRGALAEARFEQLFGTPHGIDLAALAAVHGIPAERPASAAEVSVAVAASLAAGGVRLVLVRTDRTANVALHAELDAAVAAALAPSQRGGR